MGNASYSHVDWDRHVTSSGYATRGLHEVFTGRQINPDLDPSKFRYREAVDSEANPETTPIILACDETGSMGELAHIIIQNALGGIMNALYTRKPVTNPQILCAGVGDAECDQAPIQVTQFEADGVNLSKQIEKIYIEGNGGGNSGESYPLVWFFAAYKTKCDAIRKRHRKGYIFTIGDECPIHIDPGLAATCLDQVSEKRRLAIYELSEQLFMPVKIGSWGPSRRDIGREHDWPMAVRRGGWGHASQ